VGTISFHRPNKGMRRPFVFFGWRGFRDALGFEMQISLRGGLSLPLIALCLTFSWSSAEQVPSSFEKEIQKTIGLSFLLSLPEGYEEDESKVWPLVIFLHGAGERGEDLDKVKVHGPPKKVAAGEKFPFILVSPQCPSGEWWTEQPVLELVDHIEKEYRVDVSRIYLTGLSMGGYGTWHFATQAPDRFAAILPVCGGGVPYKMRWIKDLPVWAFHGDADSVVPVEESSRLIKALEKQGNTWAKLTVYPGVGHDSWTATYDNEEVYEWMLSQVREEN